MKKYLVLALILLGFNFVSAQDNRIMELALEKLDREIIEVRQLAERYNITRVTTEIDQAKTFYDEAKHYFDLFKNFPQFNVYRQRAITNYTKSKAAVKRAFKQILFQPTTRILNDTDQRLNRAESLIQGAKNAPEAVAMLNRARRFRDLAGKSLRDETYLRAQEYLRVSSFFAQKAIDLLDGTEASEQIKADEYQRSWQNLNQLFNQYSSRPAAGKEAANLTTQIRQYFQKAGAAYENGHLKEAVLNLQLAERLLFRFLDLQDSSGDEAQKLLDQITDLKQVLDGLELESLGQENPQYNQMFGKARQYLLEAEELAGQGALIRAKQSLNLAQRLVTKIQQTKGRLKNYNSAELTLRISDLKQVVLKLRERSAQNETAGNLLTTADQSLKNAEDRLNNQNPAQAHLWVQSALHPVLQADRLMNNEEFAALRTGQDIQIWYKDLQDKVNRLRQSTEMSENRLIIENLEKELARAGKLIDSGQSANAAIWLSVIEQQVNDIVKHLVN